jgi:acetyl esterase/lipase
MPPVYRQLWLNGYMLPIGLLAAAFARVVRRRWQQGPLRPSWSLPVEIANELVRSHLAVIYRLDAAAARQQQERFASSLPSPILRRVGRRRETIGGVEGEWLTPAEAAAAATSETAPMLLYFHGGGYVLGSLLTHGDLVATLTQSAGVRTYFPSYRLAPEHPFPAAVDDAVAVYEGLLAAGVPPAKIVVGGDSAGGGLSLALLLRLRDAGRPLPAGALLISPWVELSCTMPSVATNARYDFGDQALLLHWANLYRGATPASDPLVSPLLGPLGGLPPLCIFGGEAELLIDEIRALADKARAAGVSVELECAADMAHDYPMLHMLTRPAKEAIDHAASFIRRQTAQ